jgi:hypothetical protein
MNNGEITQQFSFVKSNFAEPEIYAGKYCRNPK